ncbi:hypothetical protein N9904_03475 [Akkermansiaceae bacterium]|nr:hypothetical protein [Akkermansiaceae bacterium]MDB4300571.1 hypothetical protein [bacterium]MDA7538536.1 hypothetical protein [Akkermansiaceae bacterium]MDB4297031.1 hypothetical protein [Akkermansiaceae bacterium]MDB4328082.1 hypothetical protein [Akkermansiaceae bacterium]
MRRSFVFLGSLVLGFATCLPLVGETNIIEGSWFEFFGPDDLNLDPNRNIIAVDVGSFAGDNMINGVLFQSDSDGPVTANNVTVAIEASAILSPWGEVGSLTFSGNDDDSTVNLENVMKSIRYTGGTVELKASGLVTDRVYEIILLFADRVGSDRRWDIGTNNRILVDDWTSRGPTQENRQITNENGFSYSVNLSADENGEINISMGKNPFPQDPQNTPPSGADNNPILNAVIINRTIPQFQIIEGNFTWQEAKEDAEAKGGRLAVLDTQEKIDSISDQLESFDGSLWIGLTDEVNEGDWKWVNGEALTINNWWSGQPDNSRGVEDYGHILWKAQDAARRWNDARGDDPNIGPGVGNQNNEKGYLLEILERPPAPPVVELESFYESNPQEEIVVDATPSAGFPEEFTYQWSFNDQPIPSFLGGTLPTFSLLGDQSQDGTWKVVVSNTVGTTEASFEYRMFVDNDSDGLSNYREENITLTNPDLADSDADGLSDPDELSIHGTDPNVADVDEDGLNDSEEIAATTDPSVADTDNDGLLDGAEVKTYTSNPKSGDTDNDGIADAAEVAAGLDINTAESIAAAVAFLTQELANRPPVDGFEEAIAAARTTGQEDVTSDPSAYNLYNAASYQAVVDQRDARPTTAEYALVLEERDSRPSLQAYNAVVADRDSRPTKEAYDAVVAQRDARPTADAYDTAIAERDARPTLGEVADARLGSVVLLPDAIENKVRLRFSIEESDELGLWTMRTEEAEVDLPLTAGKRFFRFSVKEGE